VRAAADEPLVFPRVPSPLVSVVVLGLRDAPRLLHCLQALHRHRAETSFEVLVGVNAPTPELDARLSAVVGPEIVRFPVNTGYAGGCNRVAALARGRMVVLLNDDCTVTDGWLDALVSTVGADDDVGAVGSRQVDAAGRVLEAGALLWQDGTVTQVGPMLPPDMAELATSRPVDYCSGASLLVRRDLWDAIGGLDETFFPAYYEDVDLCLEIARRGADVWFQPDSVVIHDQGASSPMSFRLYLGSRNRPVLVERWRAELAAHDAPPARLEPQEIGAAIARVGERIALRQARRRSGGSPGPGRLGVPAHRPRSTAPGAGAVDVQHFLRAELDVRLAYDDWIATQVAELESELGRVHQVAAHLHDRSMELLEEVGGARAALAASVSEREHIQAELDRIRSAPLFCVARRVTDALHGVPVIGDAVDRVRRWMFPPP